MRDFQTLYYLIYLDTLTGDAEKAMKAEALEEALGT